MWPLSLFPWLILIQILLHGSKTTCGYFSLACLLQSVLDALSNAIEDWLELFQSTSFYLGLLPFLKAIHFRLLHRNTNLKVFWKCLRWQQQASLVSRYTLFILALISLFTSESYSECHLSLLLLSFYPSLYNRDHLWCFWRPLEHYFRWFSLL